MTFTSIVCVKADVESVLEALNNFGVFHIEQGDEDSVLTDYKQQIQRVEESLTNIKDLINQLLREKASFFDMFKISQPDKVRVTAENWLELFQSTDQEILNLKKEVEELNVSLSSLREKTDQLKHIKEMLVNVENMGADLAAMEELKLIRVIIASVPHKNYEGLETAVKGLPLILHRCYLKKDVDFVCSATSTKHLEEFERILSIHHAEIFQIPADLPHELAEALVEVNNRLEQTDKEERLILQQMDDLGKKNKNKLASWKEITENILALMNAEKKISSSGRLAAVNGFVPQKKVKALSKKVHESLGEKVLVISNEPTEVEDPPTRFSHSRFVAPFEEITKLYGMPHYDEVDPTPIIAITFPLIFGLMFGDVGHGLLLLFGGLAVGILIKKNRGIKNVCFILAACGFAAIVAGLLYGEFFGREIFHPLWLNPFNTANNVFSFLIFSLFVGVIQIMSGLVLEMVDFLLRRNVVDALLISLPKMAFYAGAVYLVSVYQLNLSLWFTGPILLVILPFFIMVLGKPVFLAMSRFSWRAVENQSEQNSFGQRLFESGDLVTRLLSNTISYTRILALLMAHWALMLVTYTVAGLIGSASTLALVLSGIVIVGGNVFVIALEGLIVFIHTLRLHFYEWFSKFYSGTGNEFKPFKQSFVYTEVEFERKHA